MYFFLYKCRYVYIFYWKIILFIHKILNYADIIILLYHRSFKFYIITISISYIILIFYTCKELPPIIFVTWKKNKNRGPLFATFSWTIISTKIIIRQHMMLNIELHNLQTKPSKQKELKLYYLTFSLVLYK